MPEFNRGHGQTDAAGLDATRATARLPGLAIEIAHRRAVEGDAEHIYINLRAALSFEAFGRALEAANPFAFCAQVAQLTWQPWLVVGRALPLLWPLALPRPTRDGASRSAQKRGTPVS